MVEARLAAGETDGWRYEDLPEDGQAWRDTLACLDADAKARCGTTFAEAGEADRRHLIRAVQELGAKDWHGFPAGRVWSLWTRYACTKCSTRLVSNYLMAAIKDCLHSLHPPYEKMGQVAFPPHRL